MALGFAGLLTLGICGGTSPEAGTGGDRSAYLPADRPENVVANLATAYRNRDLAAYEGLFAPEFVFWFQPGDVKDVGRESWGLAEELESARNLFGSGQVCSIEVDLVCRPAAPATERGLEHTVLVRTSRMRLTVNECAGITHRVVNDIQEFHLRRQHEGAWVIVRWRDLPGSGLALLD
jgi:hypothetical protein